MDLPNKLKNLKRISAVLLLLCIFLPLSQCEMQREGKSPSISTRTISAEVVDWYADLDNKVASDGLFAYFAPLLWLLVFSWPALLMVLYLPLAGSRLVNWLKIMEPLFCLVGGFFLFGFVVMFSTRILFGGYLALASMAAYFGASIMESVSIFRTGRRRRQQ